MVVGVISEELASSVSAARLWKAGVTDALNLVPKLMPQFVKDVVVLEGDGGEGTILQFNFIQADVGGSSFVKDKILVKDGEKYEFKYEVIESGHVKKTMESFVFEIKIEPVGEGSVMKMKIEYDTIGDIVLGEEPLNEMKDGVIGLWKVIEDFLAKNPTEYCA